MSIHCGSRGLGHQIGTEFLKEMVLTAKASGIELIDRELACAPINSEVGGRYLDGMRAAINCALANREILGHYARRVFAHFFPDCDLRLLFDVSHNTCKVEMHAIGETRARFSFIARAPTRALGPGHASLPEELRAVGQPVLIGGSMGTGPIFWSAQRRLRTRPLPRRAMAPDGGVVAAAASSSGADARSWTTLRHARHSHQEFFDRGRR